MFSTYEKYTTTRFSPVERRDAAVQRACTEFVRCRNCFYICPAHFATIDFRFRIGRRPARRLSHFIVTFYFSSVECFVEKEFSLRVFSAELVCIIDFNKFFLYRFYY